MSWREVLRRPRRGFTLVEMVVVLAALGLVLLLVAGILVGVLRTEQMVAGVSHRLTLESALADQFREDVALASAAPETLGEQTAGPELLILRLAEEKYILYCWHEGILERFEVAGTKMSAHPMPLGDDRVSVEFSRSAGGRVLSLRLVEPGRGNQKREVEFAAALGGDLR
jgi:prepilin-type N-terminal cleavage/methylation domain-containing protein